MSGADAAAGVGSVRGVDEDAADGAELESGSVAAGQRGRHGGHGQRRISRLV